MAQRLGIAVSGGPNPSEIVELVTLAESLGYESAWVAEGHGGDQFAVLSGCAMQTSTIRLGTAISSVYVRSIPTIAMAAATVDDLSEGRFILGLGSSHKVQVVPEHGVEYSKPITRLRESVDIIRQLLETGTARFQGETVTIENFDLWFRPRRPDLPIYAAAVFPKMMAVCGEIADGIILTRSTLQTGAQVKQCLAEGAALAGRDPGKVEVTSLLPIAVGDNRQ
ncbi:MAG: LLM class flavin-dependent oxidoreductase, partial [Rhodospirillaceae bacterium]|nr:LLM class flavin-dependent oxidoreductase [Rhodospirillaceae bacterium]